jgi:hypothetical protein
MNLINCALSDVHHLFAKYHGYKSVGGLATYCQGVLEDGVFVAAFVWSPPPPGPCMLLSSAPGGAGVLALSRMVAVPKEERQLQKLSKPLRKIMRDGNYIDRGRWPVLLTYSDSSLIGPSGKPHSGHVYLCSGWTKDCEVTRPYYENPTGQRVSSYTNGQTDMTGKQKAGDTVLTRWVHRVCPTGTEEQWMNSNGWYRTRDDNKRWASGSVAHSWAWNDPRQEGLFT